MKTTSSFLLLLCMALTAATAKALQATAPLVKDYEQAMITTPPTSLTLDTFYKKYADAFGIPIVSSHKVPNAALLMARDSKPMTPLYTAYWSVCTLPTIFPPMYTMAAT